MRFILFTGSALLFNYLFVEMVIAKPNDLNVQDKIKCWVSLIFCELLFQMNHETLFSI